MKIHNFMYAVINCLNTFIIIFVYMTYLIVSTILTCSCRKEIWAWPFVGVAWYWLPWVQE